MGIKTSTSVNSEEDRAELSQEGYFPLEIEYREAKGTSRGYFFGELSWWFIKWACLKFASGCRREVGRLGSVDRLFLHIIMLLKLITKGSFRTFTGCVRRVLICPDKYKFSLTSAQVSDAIKKSIPSGVESRVITLADGGEGSLETIATKMSGKWVSCQVADPLFRTI